MNNLCIENESNKISLDYVLIYRLTIKYKLRVTTE